MPRSEPAIRWRLSHLQRIQASAIWGLCKANSRNTEEDDQDSQYCWNSLTLPHPLSVHRPELLETWNPWVVLRAGWRTLQEKPSGQGAKKKTVDAQESGENFLFFFLFAVFFMPASNPSNPVTKGVTGATGTRRHRNSWEGCRPPELEELPSRKGGEIPSAFSLSLSTHLVWEASTAPGSKLRGMSFPARGLKGQGWKIPGRW